MLGKLLCSWGFHSYKSSQYFLYPKGDHDYIIGKECRRCKDRKASINTDHWSTSSKEQWNAAIERLNEWLAEKDDQEHIDESHITLNKNRKR